MNHLPSCADAQELESVGLTGLIAAVDKYDDAQKKTFKGYAAVRIRGAILDELRKMDTLPRTRRAKVRRLQDTVEKLEQKLGRVPTDSELADEMGMTLVQLRKYQSKAQTIVVVSLDGATNDEGDAINLHDAIPDERIVPSLDSLEKIEMSDYLADALHHLNERQQSILKHYYFENKRLSEIAKIYQVSEARICQIHNQALCKLRKALNSSLSENVA